MARSARTIPWLALLTVARAVWERIRDDLDAGDRRRLGRILRTRPDHVSRRDIDDLRRILGKIDLRTAGKDLAKARIARGRVR